MNRGTYKDIEKLEADLWEAADNLRANSKLSPFFAVFLMRAMDLKQYNGGVSVPTLDRKTVHRAAILIPTKGLLTAFDDFARPVFQQIQLLTAEVDNLRAARDLLLPRLMTGKVPV